jgi:hypothetical protein
MFGAIIKEVIMKQLFTSMLVLVVILAPVISNAERNCAEVDDKKNCTLYSVSLIELIANPTQFDGKRVRIIGFLRLEFEGTAIYLSREDFENGITKNGLWVSTDQLDNTLSNRYVLLEGTFNASNPGHRGLWSGAIEKITRVQKWR